MISLPGRIPIQIHPIFWLLIGMIGWLNSNTIQGTLIWSAVIFFSILIHEYGHALTALMFHQKVEMHFVALGGLTKYQGPTLNKWQEFLIVLNGPLAGFSLCFLVYYIANQSIPTNNSVQYALQVAFRINLFWTILNLAPVIPLDGGHLLRIILEAIFGFKGQKIAFIISVIIGGILGIYFLIAQQIFVGAIFLMMAFESYQAWSQIKIFNSHDTDESLQSILNEGFDLITSGKTEEALKKFTFIRDQAPKGVLYVSATQAAARILVEQGQLKKAYDWLIPLQNRLAPDYLQLLQQIAYRLQEWEQAIKIGQQAYQSQPSYEIAIINALSYAIMGQAEPSVGWLRAAGLYNIQGMRQLLENREFDVIRSTKVFQLWLHSIH